MTGFSAVKRVVPDIIVAGLSVVLAMYLRLGQNFFKFDPDLIVIMTIAFVLIATPNFFYFGLYRGVWRYTSLDDLFRIAKAVTVSVVCFFAFLHLWSALQFVPRSLPAIQWLLLLCGLAGPRLLFRIYERGGLTSPSPKSKAIPVLLVGVSDGGDQFLRATRSSLERSYRVVGILDDRPEFKGRLIQGVAVLGKSSELRDVVTKLASRGCRPQRLIITEMVTAVDRDVRRKLLGSANELGLSVARLPGMAALQRAENEHGELELNPIALEDLLGRPQVSLNRQAIADLIKDRCVLVTGAGGTIGSELTRQIADLAPKTLVMLDFSEFNLYTIEHEIRDRNPDIDSHAVICNIRDQKRVLEQFAHFKPHLVFHAAALKHVPLVEANPCEGVLTNTIGTQNVADAAWAYNALAMVQVSSDKAVNPTSVMGATKRLAEFYCQALDLAGQDESDHPRPRFMTVRFGNVLGSSGSVVPLFRKQIAKGGPVTITHPDMRRYFMTVREAVELVLQASAYGTTDKAYRDGRIFVLDMADPIKVVDIARQMISLAGLRPDLDIKIKTIGLRDGEKLFEELFDQAEQRLPAVTDGVLGALSQPIAYSVLKRAFEELAKAGSHGDPLTVRRLIKTLLPSYAGAEEGGGDKVVAIGDKAVASMAQSRQMDLLKKGGVALPKEAQAQG